MLKLTVLLAMAFANLNDAGQAQLQAGVVPCETDYECMVLNPQLSAE